MLFSMVFQNPMTSLNPTMKIGAQIAEAVRVHEPKIRKAELDGRVLELLGLVGIDQCKRKDAAVSRTDVRRYAPESVSWQSHWHRIHVYFSQMNRRRLWM